VTRIAESKDHYLCGYRRLVTPAGTDTKEESVPIHVLTKDLQLGVSSVPALDGEQGPMVKRARDSLTKKRVHNPVVDRSTAESGRQGKASVTNDTSHTKRTSMNSASQPGFKSRSSLAENMIVPVVRESLNRTCKQQMNFGYALLELESSQDDRAPLSYQQAEGS
jgi:hypothetical protein